MNTPLTAQEARQAFLDFFRNKQHKIVPSAPIVLQNDPTLMFTNAGMNQFKALFLGETSVVNPRVADTQRCLRVSGKHNDLEEVGIDTYHHTMFEMLGNWSFGDYFKKEAIAWSWELLTEVYKIPKDQLYVSVFEGDPSENIPMDSEAFEIWKQFVPEDRIILGNKKDNFWEMGETGPCGPCSEIHVDSRTPEERAAVSGKSLVNADHPQVIEIWNNVFIQFNRIKDGSLQQLPNKHVDTGMGFERLVRVLQNKTSNYDTDVFQPLIQYISEQSGIKYNGNAEPGDADWGSAVAMRVMADHIRAISFVIADGQLPSNNKAGYVIRRILRRAVRYAYTNLGFREPFLNQLVPLLAEQFKGVFDELYSQKDFVQKVVLEEEKSFLNTLANGIKLFNEFIRDHNQNLSGERVNTFVFGVEPEEVMSINVIPGLFAFLLYDTFGFPIDLTELMAKEVGFTVNLDRFNEALSNQKKRSRSDSKVDTSDWIAVNEDEQTEFVGYDVLSAETQIVKYRQITVKGETQYQLVLSITPFYAESGGQVGDTGKLVNLNDQSEIHIKDTKKENGLIVHFVDTLPAQVDGTFLAVVNRAERVLSQDNHSATHLMHAALKQVLGDHVNQKGSLVSPTQLRFDFSHFSKVTDEQLQEIEQIVNEKIRENIPLKEARNVPYQQALDSGVTALFGEKYGDFVRVITFDDNFSKELCGGTHVQATGEIGYFKIVSESAVAAGVRRIEALTATTAIAYMNAQLEEIQKIKSLFKGQQDVASAINALMEENANLKKEAEKRALKEAELLKHELVHHVKTINGINFIAKHVDLASADAVKGLAFGVKDMVDNLFLVLTTSIDQKPGITIMISDNLVKEKDLNASKIVRDLGKLINGGGGGQSFYATAGGKHLAGLSDVFTEAEKMIR